MPSLGLKPTTFYLQQRASTNIATVMQVLFAVEPLKRPSRAETCKDIQVIVLFAIN
jgi:hypothetical protein